MPQTAANALLAPKTLARAATLLLIAGVGLSLGGCTVSSLRLGNDFGRAVRQNIAVQTADPSPSYIGLPAPGAIGTRVGLAQYRYNTGAVIPPATTSTSSVSMTGP